jgi:hypothetical protein
MRETFYIVSITMLHVAVIALAYPPSSADKARRLLSVSAD